MRLLVIFLISLALTACLESGQLSINSSSDFSARGLSIEAEDIPQGGMSKITIKLNYENPRTVTFRVKTAPIYAVEGLDYQAIDGNYTIAAGQTELTLPLTSFVRSQLPRDLSLAVNVSDVSGAQVLNSQAIVTLKAETYDTPLVGVKLVSVSTSGASCATLSDKKTYCWGYNTLAQVTANSATSASEMKTQMDLQSDPSKLSSHYQSNCALYANGKVYCWGANAYGQVATYDGAAAVTASIGPLVRPAQEPAVDVATGYFHTCVVLGDGTVGCKGRGAGGRLGNNATTDAVTDLVFVSGLPQDAVKVAAGQDSSCAVLDDGSVYCWGGNDYGTLGNGTTSASPSLVATASLITTGAKDITAGTNHFCAQMTDNTVKCWGQNLVGEVGVGSTSVVSTPTAVTLSSTVTSVQAGGRVTCALLSNGEPYCWGYNGLGGIGDGTTTTRTSPTKVLALSDKVSSIAVGYINTCAILQTDGRLMCWGNNLYGQAKGFGITMPFARDLVHTFQQKVKDIFLSTSTSPTAGTPQTGCVILTTGETKCWGDNQTAQLGRLEATLTQAPLGQVTGLGATITKALSGGVGFMCALLESTGVQCWGSNSLGQIGNGGVVTAPNVVDPPDTPTGLSTGVTQVIGNSSHVCALLTGGTVSCWGSSTYGQAGICATSRTTPLTIVDGASANITNIVQVATNATTSCALNSSGVMKCWGLNIYGIFANGVTSATCTTAATDASAAPVKFKKIALGKLHACGIATSGAAYCWGNNITGSVAQTSSDVFLTPLVVPGLESGVTDITAGDYHSCAVLSDGSVRCWGLDSLGQLGTNTRHQNLIYTPTQPVGLGAGIKSIRAGAFTTCAITEDDYVKCWGANTGVLDDLGSQTVVFPHEVYDAHITF